MQPINNRDFCIAVCGLLKFKLNISEQVNVKGSNETLQKYLF